jgi:hypothetical protein
MGRFDGVEHIACWVPHRRIGLLHAISVDAANHQAVLARQRQRESGVPLPEAVFAFIPSELCRMPALAAGDRQIYVRHTAIAAKGDPARLRRRASANRIARMDVRDEGSGNHPGDWHRLPASLIRSDGGVRSIENTITCRRPVVGVGLIENFDVVEHLDPIDSAPAGNDEL